MKKKHQTDEQNFIATKIFKKPVGLIKDFVYGIKVKIHNKFFKNKTSTNSKNKKAETRFIVSVLIYPVTIFLVFYIFVNFNSILLSFKQYNYNNGRYEYLGLDNFKQFFYDLKNSFFLKSATKNSLILFFISLFLSLPLHISCSYFIYKKIVGSEIFKILLFLPNLLSIVVMTLMYKYFVDNAVPAVIKLLGFGEIKNLFLNPDTAFQTILFFNVWFGMGGGIIIYTGTMSRVPESLIEYGQLEGISYFKEFTQIVIPLIYPTISVFLVSSIAGLFINQANLYTFFGSGASQNLFTYGYYLFTKVVQGAPLADYPYASAAGLVFTFIAAPITLLTKYLLEKFGPSVDY